MIQNYTLSTGLYLKKKKVYYFKKLWCIFMKKNISSVKIIGFDKIHEGKISWISHGDLGKKNNEK